MFFCHNQSCSARWAPDEVEIHNEGQGPLFRCPLCGARNHLKANQGRDGAVTYKQIPREHVAKTPPSAEAKRATHPRRRS